MFQNGLCDAPEQESAHTRELASADHNEIDALLVNEAQDLVRRCTRTVHALGYHRIGQECRRCGKDLVRLLCRRPYICRTGTHRGGTPSHARHVPSHPPDEQHTVTPASRPQVRECACISALAPSRTSRPALFVVFIREILSNSFFIPTIILHNEKKLTRPTENDRLTLHISE